MCVSQNQLEKHTEAGREGEGKVEKKKNHGADSFYLPGWCSRWLVSLFNAEQSGNLCQLQVLGWQIKLYSILYVHVQYI